MQTLRELIEEFRNHAALSLATTVDEDYAEDIAETRGYAEGYNECAGHLERWINEHIGTV